MKTKPADIPTYSLTEAARLAGVSRSTLRSWVHGRSYLRRGGEARSPGFIRLVPGADGFLTFTNVIEAHVLGAMRKQHGLGLDKIREAVCYVEERLDISHPLARQSFRTDGVDLFVEHLGDTINASRHGQLIIKAFDERLDRIKYDSRGEAIGFFPLWLGESRETTPRLVEVRPNVAFGRPTIAGTGVSLRSIIERFRAGESIASIAEDYEIAIDAVEEALRAQEAAS